MKRFFSILVAFFAVLPAIIFAQEQSVEVDSAFIRPSLQDTWFTAPLQAVRAKGLENITTESGITFQVRMEEDSKSAIIVVAPESFMTVNYIDYQSNSILKTEQRASYQRDGQGSWLLYRNKQTGKPERIIMYFCNNPSVYLQLRPDEGKTLADVIVYNAYLCRSVPIGIPFENIYRISFKEVYNYTRKTIPWQSVIAETGLYDDSIRMIQVIRSRLNSISYVQDAAYNEHGELYSITTGKPFVTEEDDDELRKYDKEALIHAADDSGKITLGAPGFAKWIVDGIVEPINGSLTRISDLIQPTVTYDGISKRGVLSQSWNLTLNLDWNRNLAAKALSVRSVRGNFSYKTGGVDVSIKPFVSSVNTNGVLASSLGYVKDIGYSINELKATLYVLAVTEPSWFYLGAIRHTSSKKPDESVFDSTAVFFPYITDSGAFDCIVFQSGKEYSLDHFIAGNPNSTVHLERVSATDQFAPR